MVDHRRLGTLPVGSRTDKCRVEAVQACRDPVAAIRSEGRTIGCAFISESLKDFASLDWIRKGTPLPTDSVTADFNADKSNVAHVARAEGKSTLQNWFNGPYRQKIVEEVVVLGGYGKALTVLTGIEPPDELEDEEELE